MPAVAADQVDIFADDFLFLRTASRLQVQPFLLVFVQTGVRNFDLIKQHQGLEHCRDINSKQFAISSDHVDHVAYDLEVSGGV